MRRYALSWLAGAMLAGLSPGLMAGGDHGGVSPGPLTALAQLTSAPALNVARAHPARVSVPVAQWVTPEGLRVFWRQNQQLPMLDVRLIYDAGAARDGDLSGLAAAVSGLLDEGTRARPAQEVAERFDQLGADFSASSYRDMALLELRVLSAADVRDPALALFAEVAAEPALADAEWRRLQESLRIGQRQRQQSPAGRAGMLFYRRLYADHPYANPPSGMVGSIERITPADLRAFHQRYYTVGNAVLVLVGDLSREDAERVSLQISQRLPAGEAAPPLPPVKPLTRAIRLHEEFPSQQVHIILGETGIAHGDPDTFPLMVANELLGGSGFGTLLMRELREQRGLTYGVSSQFIRMRAAGPFQIGFSTRADQADMALRLTRELLQRFVDRGAPAADVQAAIDTLVQSFPRSIANNEQIAGFLGMIAFYGLPTDYLDHYIERLRAVTPGQVRDALRRHIHPDRLLVVTVGRKSAPVPMPSAADTAAAASAVRLPVSGAAAGQGKGAQP